MPPKHWKICWKTSGNSVSVAKADFKSLPENMKKPCNHCGYRASSWSCWADSNRRPHPYQVLESLPALPVQGFPLLFSPKRMRSRPVHSIVSIRSFSRVGHGVGQAENTGRISCRMPVFSSCCFAQVTRVTSPTNRRSFFRRIIAGCQTADKHQIAALCRPYSLQWRRKIIDLLK